MLDMNQQITLLLVNGLFSGNITTTYYAYSVLTRLLSGFIGVSWWPSKDMQTKPRETLKRYALQARRPSWRPTNNV